MNPLEWLLLRLSHAEETSLNAGPDFDFDAVCRRLLNDFPELPNWIRGARVLDFGCGHGLQAVAFAKLGADHVLALDINEDSLASGRREAVRNGVQDRVEFAVKPSADDLHRYDIVFSLNSMEHFSDPDAVLQTMASLLKPEGRLLVSFDPTWYSPWGAHMRFFTDVPWVHLLFPESTVMAVRARYRDDGARRYEDVRGGLNKMSVARYERLLAASGLRTTAMRKVGIRGIRAFATIPVLRELLVPRIISVSRIASAPAEDIGPEQARTAMAAEA